MLVICHSPGGRTVVNDDDVNIKTRRHAMNNAMHAPIDAHALLQLHSYERHRHSLAAAMNWLSPYAVGTTTVATAATPAPSEPDFPSPSSPSFRAAGGAGTNKETDSGSSSSASSSSSADAFSFSTPGPRSPSTSTSALCFGAGGAGMRLWTSSKALARASNIHAEEDAAPAASVAPKGYAVGRHLRWISRRLRKARAGNKETAAAPRRGAVDDTARERAEAVASAIAHCKETLRRGTPRRRRLPSPLSSLSLDLWLRDRQDEIIASAAAHCDCDDECGDARPPAAFFPTALAGQAPCLRLPHVHGGREFAAAPASTGTSSSSEISGLVASRARETETRGGFSELEFLETLDGDEELIDRHFITVQI